MPLATLPDFNMIDETSGATEDVPEQWEAIRKILWDLAAIKWSIEYAGTEPDTGLTAIYLGTDENNRKKICIDWDLAAYMRIRYNSNTDASPVWTNLLRIHASTRNVELYAGLVIAGTITGLTGLTFSGNLDMNSNNILNVANIAAATLNSWDPDAHSARHAVGGLDAISVGTPVDIAGANAEGGASNFCRRDHAHEGVHQVVAGTAIALSPSGGLGDVTVALEHPYGLHTNTGTGNQAYGASVAEVDVTGLIQKDWPSTPDGSKWFEVSGCVSWYYDGITQGKQLTSRIYVGTAGDMSDGAGAIVLEESCPGEYLNGREVYLSSKFGPYPIQPAALTKIGISAQCTIELGTNSNPGPNTVIAGVSPNHSYLYIKEIGLA